MDGIFLELFPLTCSANCIALFCAYYQITSYKKYVQILTLTIFLAISPLFDILQKFLSCISMIVESDGTKGFRAFYFAGNNVQFFI